MADITTTSCLRTLVSVDLCENLQKMSHSVLDREVMQFIVDLVGLRVNRGAEFVGALPIQAPVFEQVPWNRKVQTSEVVPEGEQPRSDGSEGFRECTEGRSQHPGGADNGEWF